MITALNLITGVEKCHIGCCEQHSYGESKMLTKIALATALALGTACAAVASSDSDINSGGYRLLGPGGVVTDGVNPVFHPSMRADARNANAYAPGPTSKRTTK
jgi:hypothetical protein